jgi:Domain of unknown function (DUF1918)
VPLTKNAKKATAKKATAKKATAKKATAKKATAKKATPRGSSQVGAQFKMTPARRAAGRTRVPVSRVSTPAEPGDLLVIDSTQVGSPPREGEVLEVIQGEVSVSYRVLWADGHQTLIAPKGGTRPHTPGIEKSLIGLRPAVDDKLGHPLAGTAVVGKLRCAERGASIVAPVNP